MVTTHARDSRGDLSRLLKGYHAALVGYGGVHYPIDLFERHHDLALLADLAGTVPWLASADLEVMIGREGAIADSIIEESGLLHALLDRNVGRLLRM